MCPPRDRGEYRSSGMGADKGSQEKTESQFRLPSASRTGDKKELCPGEVKSDPRETKGHPQCSTRWGCLRASTALCPTAAPPRLSSSQEAPQRDLPRLVSKAGGQAGPHRSAPLPTPAPAAAELWSSRAAQNLLQSRPLRPAPSPIPLVSVPASIT